MILLLSATVAVLFGCGVYLVLHPGALRVVAGTVLLTNAVIFFLLAVSDAAPAAPILPFDERAGDVADPVVQALALTAIVIGFAVTAVLLAFTYRLFVAHRTLLLQEVARAEVGDDDFDPREDSWC
ncbi:MAG: sodium:proton antiporter [Myxococcales bacterium]|nr:sodium:proton antiporter [Myxococcales bacterium]